ncbi:SPOR domain-containing protein [Sphingomonas sp. HT-1]|uniref:SPOR domain-containing protein n=1 Tax=unclassified Sphingomonas TaxID=196159 RepID=UPI000A7121B0|nr:SPOR domain-containing protein [Sphingomonas sp. WG]
MLPRTMLTIAAMLATALGGPAPARQGVAIAQDAESAEQIGADTAVRDAEAAVARDPDHAGHRAALGKAYLRAGRFISAAQALEDAYTLHPQQDQRVALNLALARVASGDSAGARTLLTSQAESIDPSDRGLALALAGDPLAAIEILTPAARAAGATARTRQNLALALALAGRWQEAKAVAAADLAPDRVNERLTQWASLVRPARAAALVAALLGVRPVADGGQPAALALVRQPERVRAEAAPARAPVPPAPVWVAQLPSSARIRKPPAPVRKVIPLQTGAYMVQLGAFENAAVARDAWQRLIGRVPPLAGHKPQGAVIASGGVSVYRLSVGGFARADADALCRAVKARRSDCFVRMAAGDAAAGWVKPGTRVAAR